MNWDSISGGQNNTRLRRNGMEVVGEVAADTEEAVWTEL